MGWRQKVQGLQLGSHIISLMFLKDHSGCSMDTGLMSQKMKTDHNYNPHERF